MTRKGWVLIGAGLALILIPGGVYVYQKIRGLRNNNPGNLRWDGTVWQGADTPPADKDGYLRFLKPTWGIRALTRDLRNKYARGLRTVTAILTVYAPPAENDTAAYITAVATELGIGPLTPLTFPTDGAQLEALVKAIIHHENGIQPYPDAVIREGISLA